MIVSENELMRTADQLNGGRSIRKYRVCDMDFYRVEKESGSEHIRVIRSACGELLYLIEGQQEAVLIDTCLGVGGLKNLVTSLTDKPLTVLLSHGHVDHSLGAPEFEKVYMNHRDIDIYRRMSPIGERTGYLIANLGQDMANMFLEQSVVPPSPDKKFQELREGMRFDLGGVSVEVYSLPGHTRGTMVFLVPEDRVFILGDACNNSTFLFDDDSISVEEYQRNVRRIMRLTEGRYDRTFLMHHVLDGGRDILAEMDQLCEDIKNGNTDDLPFEFMGHHAFIAKNCNQYMERIDGKFANLVHKKENVAMKNKYLVIDVGGTYVKYAVMDEDCNFIEKGKKPVVKDTLANFIDMLVSIYNTVAGEVSGIAISAPGMIDSESGFMYNGGSIFCIENVNIVEILQRRCHVPVSVENDAKCAGLAEVWKGSLETCRNGVAMIIGTAVGGAVIVDRKVLHGKNFMAGEFSYIFTNADEYQERAKLSAEANGVPGLIKMVSNSTGVPGECLDGEKIFAMANEGNEKVLDALRVYCRQIAIQISNFQYTVDPDRVVLGGGISVQPLFLQLVREELRKLNDVFPYTMPIPEVATCKFFNDANLIGALYVHLSAKKTKVDVTKVLSFLELVEDQKDRQYLKELFMSR